MSSLEFIRMVNPIFVVASLLVFIFVCYEKIKDSMKVNPLLKDLEPTDHPYIFSNTHGFIVKIDPEVRGPYQSFESALTSYNKLIGK